MINAAVRAGWNFPIPVELDIGGKVARKIHRRPIRQVVLKRELVYGGIDLTEIVDACVAASCRVSADEIRRSYKEEESETQAGAENEPDSAIPGHRHITSDNEERPCGCQPDGGNQQRQIPLKIEKNNNSAKQSKQQARIPQNNFDDFHF
jgi:hypothetical protein